MTREDAYLRAVAEHPDDCAPLLTYADWLEERGDPRGEILRLQSEVTWLADDDPHRQELEAREEALWRDHAPDQLKALVRFPRPAETFWRQLLWHRSYRTDLEFPPHGGSVLRTPVRQVKLEWEFGDGPLRELANCPWLACVTCFDLPEYDWGGHGDSGARALASSPYLARLVSLQVAMNDIGDAGIQALAASPYLTRLAYLGLGGDSFGQVGVQALVSSPYLTRLLFLDLDSIRFIGSAGAQTLAVSPNLADLVLLDLAINTIGDEGTQALAASPHLTRLTSLNLTDNSIGDVGAEALATSTCLTSLTSLKLRCNDLSEAVAELLRRRFGKGVDLDHATA